MKKPHEILKEMFVYMAIGDTNNESTDYKSFYGEFISMTISEFPFDKEIKEKYCKRVDLWIECKKEAQKHYNKDLISYKDDVFNHAKRELAYKIFNMFKDEIYSDELTRQFFYDVVKGDSKQIKLF